MEEKETRSFEYGDLVRITQEGNRKNYIGIIWEEYCCWVMNANDEPDENGYYDHWEEMYSIKPLSPILEPLDWGCPIYRLDQFESLNMNVIKTFAKNIDKFLVK